MTHYEHQPTLLSYVLVGAILLEVAHGSPSPHIEEHSQACQVTSSQTAPLSGHLDLTYSPRQLAQESARPSGGLGWLCSPAASPTGMASYLTGE